MCHVSSSSLTRCTLGGDDSKERKEHFGPRSYHWSQTRWGKEVDVSTPAQGTRCNVCFTLCSPMGRQPLPFCHSTLSGGVWRSVRRVRTSTLEWRRLFSPSSLLLVGNAVQPPECLNANCVYYWCSCTSIATIGEAVPQLPSAPSLSAVTSWCEGKGCKCRSKTLQEWQLGG